jgi:hypothetical protein
MPLLETKGAASAQGFGLTLRSGPVTYIEDVFSTYLYTGNGSTQTITNGIDLSTKGGLVWIKCRSAAFDHALFDTVRGNRYGLSSDTTNSQTYSAVDSDLTSFNGSGFSLGSGYAWALNNSSQTFASWTFRKQPKFFDIQVFNGSSTGFVTVNHNLGSTPGFIVYKRIAGTPTTNNWIAYHRSLATNDDIYLNLTSAKVGGQGSISDVTSTSARFYDSGGSASNQYVAYFFAHNAGGFGLSGSDNVISCGSFTTDGSGNATVNLGYEPQWILTKTSSVVNDWELQDSMRGLSYSNNGHLQPNTSAVENPNYVGYTATATGFNAVSRVTSATYIYIAIRRGPMKVPTSGTSVYKSNTRTGNGTEPTITGVGFVPDLIIPKHRQTGSFGNSTGHLFADRLRGNNNWLFAPFTDGETGSDGNMFSSASQTYNIGWSRMYESGIGYVDHVFRRAPGFFDVVCYTGTGSATTFNHNLGVAPELVIVKWRTGATGENWAVMCTPASSSPDRRFLYLDLNAAGGGLNGKFADSSGTPVLPTATQVYIGTNDIVNKSAATYVAYLFATCAGVSKVGSYTGSGTTKQIDCGFTGGARFVLIKRTDSTGDWYVWDTARGIVSGNDPYLLLNGTAAEVTSTDYIDTYSAGFEISSTAPAAINASGGTFIFLAIA